MAFDAGKIVSQVTLDHSKFTQSVKVVKKQTNTLGGWAKKNSRQFRMMGMAIAAMGAVAVVTFRKMVTSYVEVGDMLHKMALRTGIGTVALSELKHAAELSGTSLEGLEKGVRIMQKAIIQAEDGLMTYVRGFERMNIAVEDLKGLSPEEQFLKIAYAMAEIEDPTIRSTAAQEIFGSRIGTQLLPMLKDGAEGLRKMRDEAHELGTVFTEEAAANAAKLKDEQLRLKRSIQGLSFAIVEDLIPVLTEVTEEFTSLFKETREGASTWTEGLLNFFKVTALGLQGLILAFYGFKLGVFAMGAEIAGFFRKILEGMDKFTETMNKAFAFLKIKAETLPWVKTAIQDLTAVEESYREEVDKQADSIVKLLALFDRLIAGLDAVKDGYKEAEVATDHYITVTAKAPTYLKDLSEKSQDFYTDIAMAAGEGLGAMLSTLKQWAIAEAVRYIFATVPFPASLILATMASYAIGAFYRAITGKAEGGWVGLHGEEIVKVGERGPEYISSNDTITNIYGGAAPAQFQRIIIQNQITIGEQTFYKESVKSVNKAGPLGDLIIPNKVVV